MNPTHLEACLEFMQYAKFCDDPSPWLDPDSKVLKYLDITYQCRGLKRKGDES